MAEKCSACIPAQPKKRCAKHEHRNAVRWSRGVMTFGLLLVFAAGVAFGAKKPFWDSVFRPLFTAAMLFLFALLIRAVAESEYREAK